MPAPLTITLPAPLADEVRAAAEARGLSPEEYVRQQLAFDIASDGGGFDDDDIKEDLAAAAEFERTGVGVPWEEVRAWMASWGTDAELPPPQPRKMK